MNISELQYQIVPLGYWLFIQEEDDSRSLPVTFPNFASTMKGDFHEALN